MANIQKWLLKINDPLIHFDAANRFNLSEIFIDMERTT